ncbi:MAG: hypothetical protein NC434_11755 [Ruminococcus sp.]|nr:hypothetical protein [Ruminococcus sp.]
MLYHVSPQSDLKILQPHVSTHGTAYVYAIEDMVTGMLFGVKQDDFDFLISNDENTGIPIICECYPDAFRTVYQGQSCSVYQVAEEGFQRGKTSWDAELVCEKEVSVIKETVIDDLYERLLEEERMGHLMICRYEFRDEYRKKISSHIVDRLIRFEIDLDKCMEQDKRFALYYKDIIRGLQNIMDGHLLQ